MSERCKMKSRKKKLRRELPALEEKVAANQTMRIIEIFQSENLTSIDGVQRPCIYFSYTLLRKHSRDDLNVTTTTTSAMGDDDFSTTT